MFRKIRSAVQIPSSWTARSCWPTSPCSAGCSAWGPRGGQRADRHVRARTCDPRVRPPADVEAAGRAILCTAAARTGRLYDAAFDLFWRRAGEPERDRPIGSPGSARSSAASSRPIPRARPAGPGRGVDRRRSGPARQPTGGAAHGRLRQPHPGRGARRAGDAGGASAPAARRPARRSPGGADRQRPAARACCAARWAPAASRCAGAGSGAPSGHARSCWSATSAGRMERYSRFLLRFAHALERSGAPVEVFVFGTRLTRITRELRVRSPDAALRRVAEKVVDWSGGTRIGESLHALNRHWVRRTIRSGAIVLLVSDGWERGDPALLAREMATLRRSCHRLLWLDPLAARPGFRARRRWAPGGAALRRWPGTVRRRGVAGGAGGAAG